MIAAASPRSSTTRRRRSSRRRDPAGLRARGAGGLRRGRGGARRFLIARLGAAETAITPTPPPVPRMVALGHELGVADWTVRLRYVALEVERTEISAVYAAPAGRSHHAPGSAGPSNPLQRPVVGDDRGNRSTLQFGGGGSDDRWDARLTTDQPISVRTSRPHPGNLDLGSRSLIWWARDDRSNHYLGRWDGSREGSEAIKTGTLAFAPALDPLAARLDVLPAGRHERALILFALSWDGGAG